MRHDYNIFRLVSIVRARFGLDAALLYALGARAWQGCSGVVTLWLVIHCMLPTEQGFYYTFSGVLNVQLFFELGLSFVILQLTPHYFTNLRWGERGALQGSQTEQHRLSCFLYQSFRGYRVLCVAYALILIPTGLAFFSLRQHEAVGFSWQLPWVFVVVGTALNLSLSPFFAAIEGSGRVGAVYRFRGQQFMLSSFCAWFTLCFGGGLWMPVVSIGVNVACSLLWLWRTHGQFVLWVMKRPEGSSDFSWRQDVWSMQWRIAISWMSGYFIAQMFTPLLFYYDGGITSGQMGVSLTIVNLLSMLCLTWISVRSPTMGNLVAQKQWDRLDHVFLSVFWQSVMAFACGALLLGVGLYVFRGEALMHRLLPWSQMVLLLMSMLCSHMVGAWSLYLRAHKTDPFMPFSLVGAFLLAFGSWYGAVHAGSFGVCWSIFLVNALYGLPSGFWLWMRCKRRWHAEEEQSVCRVF